MWKLSLSCPPVQQGASGSPANTGEHVGRRSIGREAPRLPPPHALSAPLADCVDTPGRNKSRRPRREKPFAGPLGNLRGSAPSRCFSCRGLKQEGGGGGEGQGGHAYVWPTDPGGLMVPFSASVTGLWGVGGKNVTSQTRVRAPQRWSAAGKCRHCDLSI